MSASATRNACSTIARSNSSCLASSTASAAFVVARTSKPASASSSVRVRFAFRLLWAIRIFFVKAGRGNVGVLKEVNEAW